MFKIKSRKLLEGLWYRDFNFGVVTVIGDNQDPYFFITATLAKPFNNSLLRISWNQSLNGNVSDLYVHTATGAVRCKSLRKLRRKLEELGTIVSF